MAKLIGTAGHVDHGKTTLIQALTGIDADRLPEEKRRGMTIDIGFAFIDLPKSGRVSIVDVPGHEKFLTNMLVGALGVDVALLCLAADEGVKPQTREHLEFLELLPVEKLIVALTRSDLADADTLELATLDARDLIEKSRFESAPILPVSAVSGAGIDELKGTLDDALQAPSEVETGPWYVPVDRAFTMKGHGPVVTGTLARNSVKVGDSAVVQPGNLSVRIRSIQSHDETIETAEPGRRIALNLSGVKVEQLQRGQVIGHPGSVFESSILDIRARRVGEIKHGMRIRASIGADEVIGKLFVNDGDPELMQLRLETPVACVKNQPIIVRNYSPPSAVAGGRIVTPQASKRKKNARVTGQVQTDDLSTAILTVLEGQTGGVPTDHICRQIGRSAQDLGSTFESLQNENRIAGFAGLWFGSAEFESATSAMKGALGAMHAEKPMVGAHPREAVVRRSGFAWAGKPLDRLIQRWAQDGMIVADGPMIRLADFQLQLNPKQRDFLGRVKEALVAAGINSPSPGDLAPVIHAPPQAIEEILRLGVESGALVRIADGVIYEREWLLSFRDTMLETYKSNPFTAAEFRDAFQTSRKYVIPLLEYFDAQGFTVRVGDKRAIRRAES